MRTITAEQRQRLEDLSAEGLLKLPTSIAEKDIHVTDLLKGLSELVVEHDGFQNLDKRRESTRHDTEIVLVFSGGTCLAKAHRLIGRMSEDIDIKVFLKPPATPLSPKFGRRSRLKVLHDSILGIFQRLDLPLISSGGRKSPHIRDQHRYCCIGAGYQSGYEPHASLRPELQLELIERPPLLPIEKRTFGYLYENLTGLPQTVEVSIHCISVSETAAEKVLSLLRRCAWKWRGYQEGEMDQALVRHIYDVARIAENASGALGEAQGIFAALVVKDRAEFAGQNPEFDADPVQVLRETLVQAKTHRELQARYEDTLLPLVYEASSPSYARAFSIFEDVANSFLAACGDAAK
ncbi:MAG TPA: nucleotidyl transferase AbiEii/AbiGii toxin family protein [Steroidobacteraceae bacterium]|nr:nucleotidyl transferase AbiEii/AbiGii toxin family protein [Steroidobacteraceae bacterium]